MHLFDMLLTSLLTSLMQTACTLVLQDVVAPAM